MRVRSILSWLTTAPRDGVLPLKNVSLCVNLDQCNLRCIMCWTTYSRGRHQRAEREMNLPLDRLLEMLHDPALAALDSICVVGGGEPFLYPWIDDLLRAGPTETRRLMIMTHGGLLDRNRAVWEVARERPLTIMVSIDGATAGTYERIRRGGRWTRVVENVERLARLPAVNPRVGRAASGVVLEQNLDEVLDFVRLCIGWNARYVHFHPAIAGEYPVQWRVDRGSQRYRDVMGAAIALCGEAGIALDAPDELLAVPSRSATTAASGPDPRRGCRLPFDSVTVAIDGETYVCDTAFRLPYSCGNVFRDGLHGAWRSRAWSSLRAAHENDRAASHPLCGHCLLLA